MRVITGSARGVRLQTPEGSHTRPTTDRVKEGMFSAIQFAVPGARVLDLFAGSGQLGIEALSRGAQSCVFVDNDRTAVECIKNNLHAAKLEESALVKQNDVFAYLKSCKEKFHLAFIDAPYHGDGLLRALSGVIPCMEPHSSILCETDVHSEMPVQVGAFVIHRSYRYSQVKITLYQNTSEEDNVP